MTVNIIAECGVNFTTLGEAGQMIIEAKDAGAAAVKFQLFNEEIIKGSPLEKELKPLILNEKAVKFLRTIADNQKIGFILTPMYEDAVELAAKYADIIKIRFKDHENTSLINKAYATGKQLLISVPHRPINDFNPQNQYLYCIPKYPPAPEDFNHIAACSCDGVSLHYPYTLFDMVFAIDRYRENVYIEKHVKLLAPWSDFAKVDGQPLTATPEPIDSAVSVTFNQLKNFINEIKLIERMKRVRI